MYFEFSKSIGAYYSTSVARTLVSSFWNDQSSIHDAVYLSDKEGSNLVGFILRLAGTVAINIYGELKASDGERRRDKERYRDSIALWLVIRWLLVRSQTQPML